MCIRGRGTAGGDSDKVLAYHSGDSDAYLTLKWQKYMPEGGDF